MNTSVLSITFLRPVFELVIRILKIFITGYNDIKRNCQTAVFSAVYYCSTYYYTDTEKSTLITILYPNNIFIVYINYAIG